MSFLQLVLSLDKAKEEIILFWRICQFDRYRNSGHHIVEMKATVLDAMVFDFL